MNTIQTYSYNPDYAVSPGEILEETLDARGIKKQDFALKCGISTKTVSLIISGNAPVCAKTALAFEHVLGVSGNIWNNLEAKYSLFNAREKEKKEMNNNIEWAKQFPLREFRKKNIVSGKKATGDTAIEIINFLGLASKNSWDNHIESLGIACKKSESFNSSPYAVASWLRLAEIESQSLYCQSYNRNLFLDNLKKIKEYIKNPIDNFSEEIQKLCAEAGVALTFVKEFPKTHLFGATKWLSKNKALIVLSCRLKTDDYFWFSFFHEAAHILLHKKREFFLDDKNKEITQQEKEADEFAEKFLINRANYRKFVKQGLFTKEKIQEFAKKENISNGVIIGRLQHEKYLPWQTNLNSLKYKFEIYLKTIITGSFHDK